jgi:hypothetical protein
MRLSVTLFLSNCQSIKYHSIARKFRFLREWPLQLRNFIGQKYRDLRRIVISFKKKKKHIAQTLFLPKLL